MEDLLQKIIAFDAHIWESSRRRIKEAFTERILLTPDSLRGSGGKAAIPPGFEADILEAQRLGARRREDDPQLIGRLIQVYERILGRLQVGDDPAFRATTQNNLGNAYAELPTGDRGTNLIQAIACFQEALRFFRPEVVPFNHAAIQNNLGTAYADLPTGDRGANLAQAIACFQQALRFWTPETAPADYAATQYNLGKAYTMLPTGDRGTNLAQAIACFQQALRFRTPETAPADYATTQDSLGTAYYTLPTGDRGANLTQAIVCYQEALRFRTPETVPADYAGTQTNLGNAYAELPTGDRGANLAQAIACFQEALHFRTSKTAPLDYARIQNNLGAAYAMLPTGDRSANLAQAIACFQQALHFWTPETAPLDYARTQNNLGAAYSDRGANLAQAIACFQEALRFFTPEVAPDDYARTQTGLGAAYAMLPTGDRGANLARAIACFQEALRFWTPETAPTNYAITQNNLGHTYADLPMGDRSVHLDCAIACYREALRFRTPETAPADYARTQTNLGRAYAMLPAGNRDTNLAQAIACYQEALRFRTPETAPSDCRTTNRNLADLHFEQRDWNSALAAYRAAMEAGERLYRAGLSIESKAAETAENAHLYRHAAFAAARLGSTSEALLILERGKTRLLTEALRLRVPRPTNVPDNVWNTFEQAGADIRAVQVKDTALFGAERDPIQAYAARIQNAQAASAALDAAVEQVRAHAPDFLKEIDLPTIQALLPDQHTALVAFCITDRGTMGFVLSHASGEPVQRIELSDFTQTHLANLLIERDTEGNPTGGWLVDYLNGDRDRWHRTMEHALAQVGKQLIAPVVATLPADIRKLILLPAGGLFLLPLHVVLLSDKDSDRLCDRYQISYAPSAEVLADSRAKAMRASGQALYAVINPAEDPRLAFTPAEGAAIASLFTTTQVQEGRAGTKQAVTTGLQGRTYLHFSCHGSYNWENPPESGLALVDGRLTLAELQSGTVDLSAARLVTLSACETGITDVFRGSAEEYVGLPAGFMLAGVPCVVSSLWSVPDISTALLMERFYRNHLNGGMDFPAALQEAQAWVRRLEARQVAEYAETCYQQSRTAHKAELLKYIHHYRYQAETDPIAKPFAHPHYWAAFAVNGM